MTDPEATLDHELDEADEITALLGAAMAIDASDGNLVDKRIGPYRILRRIGEGGMGAVYLAEREDHFKQQVALKIIHPEEATDEALQCFYAERQILADLKHPHIAQIFDGGATQSTLPFFVMEYVEGKPFDKGCADLPLVERLKLFQKVCAAVQHAHRSLIVHCDLKPSNILVTADGEPKLLDFGIAKLLRQEVTETESGSRSGPGPMSLAFASPEQLNGDPITIGTDIYALGSLLYKILCGRHPHYRPGISTSDLADAIRYAPPKLPSEHIDSRAASKVAGDLDAIALTALSKRPEDRYDSATQLAEEIQLHLDDLPIRAWPGTWLGRLRKSARRNKWVLALTALLMTFSIAVTGLWRHAVEQRAEAEHAQAQAEHAQAQAEHAQTQAEQTAEFILNFFRSVEPDNNPGPEIDLKKILDSGRRKLEENLRDQPEIRADLLGTVARAYHALALHDDALDLQIEVLDHRRALESQDTRKLAVDLNNLGSSYYARSEYGKAETLFREAMSLWHQLEDPFELQAFANLAAALNRQNKSQEALEVYASALERAAELSIDQHPNTAPIYYGLGALHKRRGEHPEAESHLSRALTLYRLDPKTKPSQIAAVQSSLGEVLHTLARHAEARSHLEDALTARLRLFGAMHSQTAASQKKLALLLLDLGEQDDAEALLKQAGDTYSALGHELGVAEVQKALERVR